MTKKTALFFFFILLTAGHAFGQARTLNVNNKINASNSLTFGVTTAGDNPTKLNLFNTASGNTTNTAQSIGYSWKFLGEDPEDASSYVVGSLKVASSVALPSGLQWTIQAAAPPNNWNGVTTGPQVLGTVQTTLLSGVWSTSAYFWLIPWSYPTITNTLTQSLIITNFSDLHPTPNGAAYTVVLTYELN